MYEIILHSVVAPGIFKFTGILISEGKTFTNNNLMVMPGTTKSLLWGGFIFRPTDMGLQVSDRQSVLEVYQRRQTYQWMVQEELTSTAGF